ncbi:hypothetical protein KTE64_31000, partial [Burkholderia multivorans]|uniref:hypothetical protein n=1 Tax=Burkholderia multivorans TaxID=87883 RepID=UPI001C2401E8
AAYHLAASSQSVRHSVRRAIHRRHQLRSFNRPQHTKFLTRPREQMIPALFGAYPDQRFYGQVTDEAPQETPAAIPMEQRAAHVLDLLTIAAPTKALDRFRQAYEDERDHAIYPERYVGTNA